MVSKVIARKIELRPRKGHRSWGRSSYAPGALPNPPNLGRRRTKVATPTPVEDNALVGLISLHGVVYLLDIGFTSRPRPTLPQRESAPLVVT